MEAKYGMEKQMNNVSGEERNCEDLFARSSHELLKK